MKLIPYLMFFNGDCREAFDFYAGALGGQLQRLFVDKLVQDPALVLHRLERARIERLALLLALAHALLFEALAELVDADLAVFPEHRHRPPAGRALPPFRRRLPSPASATAGRRRVRGGCAAASVLQESCARP